MAMTAYERIKKHREAHTKAVRMKTGDVRLELTISQLAKDALLSRCDFSGLSKRQLLEDWLLVKPEKSLSPVITLTPLYATSAKDLLAQYETTKKVYAVIRETAGYEKAKAKNCITETGKELAKLISRVSEYAATHKKLVNN